MDDITNLLTLHFETFQIKLTLCLLDNETKYQPDDYLLMLNSLSLHLYPSFLYSLITEIERVLVNAHFLIKWQINYN